MTHTSCRAMAGGMSLEAQNKEKKKAKSSFTEASSAAGKQVAVLEMRVSGSSQRGQQRGQIRVTVIR